MGDYYDSSDKPLRCPPHVRSCYECHRPARACPHEQPALRECDHCHELVDESKGRECDYCDDWLCNACAAWEETPHGGYLICGKCAYVADSDDETTETPVLEAVAV